MQDELIRNENVQSVGERLYTLRNQYGFTQEDLAEKLAVSRQSISKWELDKTLPDVDKLMQLSDIYQVSMDYLVKGVEPAAKSEVEGDSKENVVDASYWKVKSSVNKVILSIGVILSGIFFLVCVGFAVGILSNQTFSYNGKQQDVVSIDRIESQYTRAQVSAMDEEGNIFTQTMWLDTIGVREGDWIFVYCDEDNVGNISMDYYTSTILLPLVMAIIFLIFLIVFITELRMIGGNRNGKEKQ